MWFRGMPLTGRDQIQQPFRRLRPVAPRLNFVQTRINGRA